MPTDVKRSAKQLPKFRNINEMANFFDTGDSEKYHWEDTNLDFARPKLIQVSIRLTEEDLKNIKLRAHRLGVGHTALMRMMLHRAITNDDDTPRKGVKGRA